MKTNWYLFIVVVLLLLAPAVYGKTEPVSPSKNADAGQVETAGYSGKVIETMNTAGYTYVQIDTGKEKIWAAAPQFQVKVGDRVTIPNGIPMKNYYSKTLNRTFETVYFVGSITAPSAGEPTGVAVKDFHADLSTKTGSPSAAAIDFKGIKKPEGGKTVAEIYAQKSTLANKKVSVRGKVVRINPQIMDKNWVHLQDGTGGKGTNDLTITTNDTTNVGDTVLVNGTLALEKDFGYGYKYEVLVENAKVTVEQQAK